jgi:hypothetical protein
VPSLSRRSALAFIGLLLSCFTTLPAQRVGNANATYQQLRGLAPGSEVITVSNLTLKRDAAVFTFTSGSFAFYNAVNGKVTGAVFQGQGHLHITPPTAEERHNLRIVTKEEEFDEDFDEAVLRFTDGTTEELKKAATGKGEASEEFAKEGQEVATFLRNHAETSYTSTWGTFYSKEFYGNLDLRLLEDVLSPNAEGFFMAAIHGKKNAHLFFILDPRGAGEVAPEEVALLKWSDWGATYPLAFHRAAEYANGTASGNEHNHAYTILSENLEVEIQKRGHLSVTAGVELRADQEGVAVVPFDLYPTLRVSKVESAKGEALDWVQENKEDDPDFGVVLGLPLKKGETTTVKISYDGKDVVLDKGGDNYYPVARENWYPNSSHNFGDYANYNMRFHVPKGLQLIATGTKVSEINEGKTNITEWNTETPLPVVGFSLGIFETKGTKLGTPLAGQLTVDAYANKNRPEWTSSLARDLENSNHFIGSLETTPMLESELSQGAAAAQIYTSYFGQLAFPHIALTQQSACNYGQSWPMLVYLPICGFFDTTERHFLGLGDSSDTSYWNIVTPHEVAHQWWGHTVGFRGYRDQWMSEGFADASASIYLQATRQKPDDFLNFWKEEKRRITEENVYGFRPIDVGPVTMGNRLGSPKAGWNVYRNLVYPKGAYILHMLRMMMWVPKEGDARFKATMQDFATTYRLKAATTEDFKAIVEKHMSSSMDLEGKHNMDWFFREYVYGTDLPAYHFEADIKPNTDGWQVHFTLTQSEVDANFVNSLPVYLELADGRVVRAGQVTIRGTSPIEQTIQLPKLSSDVKKVLINYNYDVLCTEN